MANCSWIDENSANAMKKTTPSCCSREMFKDSAAQNIFSFSCCSPLDRRVIAKTVKMFHKLQCPDYCCVCIFCLCSNYDYEFQIEICP